MNVLLKPVITEKSMYAATQGVYTFLVDAGATKHQIKEAVQGLFGVHVIRVNTATVTTADTRTGRRRITSSHPPRKFARVSLKKGETIALFDLSEDQR